MMYLRLIIASFTVAMASSAKQPRSLRHRDLEDCSSATYGVSCQDGAGNSVCSDEDDLIVTGECDSCHGTTACVGAHGTVGAGSCSGGTDVCRRMGVIGRGSKGGSQGATVGDGSCLITKDSGSDACSHLTPRSEVGDGSCIYRSSCKSASAIIGDDSCKGSYACSNVGSTLNQQPSIDSYSHFIIGDGSCKAKKACCGAQRDIGSNSCNTPGECCVPAHCDVGCDV